MAKDISVPQASRIGKIFPQYVYVLLTSGKLQGEKDENGEWRITLDSFQRWLQTRKKRTAKN